MQNNECESADAAPLRSAGSAPGSWRHCDARQHKSFALPFPGKRAACWAPSFPNFFVIRSGRRPYQHLKPVHLCSRPQRKAQPFSLHNETKINGPSSADSGGAMWCSPRHLRVLHKKHCCMLSWLLVWPCSHNTGRKALGCSWVGVGLIGIVGTHQPSVRFILWCRRVNFLAVP